MDKNSQAARLAQIKPQILKTWSSRVKDSPISDFIDKLIEALESSDSQKQSIESQTWSHPQSSIEAIVSHHDLLREIIFSALETEAPLQTRERDIILRSLSASLSHAVKSQNEQLQMERSTFEAVISQMPSAVWVAKAPTGELLIENDFARIIMKQPTKDKRNLSDYGEFIGFFADGRRYAAEDWPSARSLRLGEIVVNEEIKVQKPNGDEGWIQVSSSPVKDSAGRIMAVVTIGVDVTEQNLVQNAKNQIQHRFEYATNATGIGVWEYDVKNNSAWRSASHDLLHGYKTVVPEWSVDIALSHIHPEDRERFQASMNASIAEAKDWNVRSCRRSKKWT